ncbi:exodeoxyribonuclease V subunit alpha [Pseudoxanthomonas sp. JBR18]|uniref:exodeoxyribonuclease V subunit alpha n=1 Tax=Pseudoxanthomonas sp. JBR18 TaxID=2969308 RepID=UPI002305A3DA|nr:exodeoxyribonuclease V subunit alpha [Pseudoxanthomonas sp. JBR18]WCE05866.1 exodeoxyribonuclease V subunit alpha [Pseudoxanthomonas sp. JBR18]
MSLLNALFAGGHLRTLDHAFAQSLRRLRPDTPDEVLAAAALASLAVANGHAGFDPARPRLLVDVDMAWPQAEAWADQLRASPWIAQPADPLMPSATDAPLAFERGLLYLRRYREYESRLAAGLQRIADQPAHTDDLNAVREVFNALFPNAAQGEDRQARAAALALRRTLLLVTGGPGTGKTTTITRLLVLRIALAAAFGRPPPRIALAAPTGRAAERMAESLRRAVTAIVASGVDAGLCAALPESASTLHRLLGVIPDSPSFRHTPDNPLPLDVLVVDEASMVDLPLMCKLVEAVAAGTQLILLGDADQLPSVEAGDVLAAILSAAGPGHALRADDAAALQPLLGDATPVDGDTGGLRGHRVQLLRGYRQDADFDLSPLADAVRGGDADTALSLLRGGTLRGVEFHEDVLDPFEVRREALLAHWRALSEAPEPATALAMAQRLRLLTAVREGPQGARGLNARIEELLSGRRTGPAPAYFHGRLLLITENSYRHRLFNGDIGICLRDGSGALLAWFAGEASGQVRAFHPAALPAHESAFAMTVHKAQGSEFDEVWLQLPRGDSRVLSRELVYTAITRARTRLHVAGSAQVLREALARHAVRMSGLAWRLGVDHVSLPSSAPAEAQAPIVEATPVQGALF